jgi:3-(methylthio)propanoyl-CoA dehydrogenase
MSDYRPPLRDVRFALEKVAGLPALAELDVFAHADIETTADLLEEVGRFAAEVIAPTNRDGDLEGAVLEGDRVRTPASFKRAHDQYVGAGWGTLQHAVEHGGGGFPLLVSTAVKEMFTSANMAFSLCPLLTTGAVHALTIHGDADLKETYLGQLVTGEWAGSMNLTEPQAGSDLAEIRTRAVPAEDGTYRIFGQKIFITFGEHDLTENIIHLVLARLPDAPPGTKGLSLFLVPKLFVNADGTLGERNDLRCIAIEHKLGIHGSPTCVMSFGDDGDGAVGFLVGEANSGMRQMFTMMNDARLGVGVQGLAIAERAFQQAVGYARERIQGRPPRRDDDPEPAETTIVDHPDVRRMIMTMRAYIEAMRCLVYVNAEALDRALHDPDPAVAAERQALADLLTPISKAWCSDVGVEVASLALQVHGGAGYIEETGAAQHYRDARIAPIYEGTNGIQAIDLVGRKLHSDGGETARRLIDEIRATATAIDDPALATVGDHLVEATVALEKATQWILAADPTEMLAGATPYLRMFGQVAGGWLLARSALAALGDLADAGADEDFLRAKITTARFYADNLLPLATSLLPAVTAGSDDLFAISAERLAS